MLLAILTAASLLLASDSRMGDHPSATAQSQKQIRHERQIGRAYKRGARIPGEVALGERAWNRDGKLIMVSSLTANDLATISEERTSYIEAYLHSRTARSVTAYKYDTEGRLIEETNTAFGQTYRTEYLYDASGRRIGAKHFESGHVSGSALRAFDTSDSLVSLCEFDKNKEPLTADSITFDAQHRRIAEIRLNFGEGGRLVSQSAHRYTYDDQGRIASQSEEAGGSQTGIKRFEYEGTSRQPARIVDGEHVWSFEYAHGDANSGKLVKETETYAGKTRGFRRFEYDNAGNLTRETVYNAKDELVDEIVHEIEYW